jgi:hypothetical protein
MIVIGNTEINIADFKVGRPGKHQQNHDGKHHNHTWQKRIAQQLFEFFFD